MEIRKYKFSATVIFASFLLMLVGCADNTETKAKDENLQTMEYVLENALTGPNEELELLIENEGLESLVKYEEDLYKDYFANDTSYLDFVNSYGSTLMIEPMRNGYKLKVRNIDFEKTDSEEMIYNFSVELQYQKEGSEKSEVEIVTGQANLNEEHKIEDMLIRIGDFLGSLGN
ncbi:hypothetical protein [Mesobacillus maritimus]|uniref:Lipoprotein n=1 Tax=Mesobacillus maritimus TaxID=1643336 RepID=A0ABS7K6F2_9BACI|nr:hypothetical protein [Mesobacillus maritimus]MBY0097864.1 hypothetical protein [Mesobacillus maritimus]